jgi:5-methylcytosine-specific restriction protein A
MPIKPGHPCAHRGCPAVVRDGRYCEEHKADGRGYDQRRPSANKRGYGTEWGTLRRMVLREEPLCRDIWGVHRKYRVVVPATEVDHIVPLEQGGTNERSNLQGLCHSCHSRKTVRDDGGFGNHKTEEIAGRGGKILGESGGETARAVKKPQPRNGGRGGYGR